MQKRQGASTLQAVRTKKPSAKKQTHNKCRNAKGLRPYKWYEPKNLRQKSKCTISAKTPMGFDLTNGTNQKTYGKKATRKNRKTDARKGGDVFSEPSASIIRQSHETTPRKERGRHFFKNKICAHCLLWQQLVNRRTRPAKH